MDASRFFTYPDTPLSPAAGDLVLLPLWDEEQWGRLFGHTEVRRFRAGEELIRLGSVDRSLCIVMRGSLDVIVPTASGQLRTVAKVGAGGVIGEIAFVDGLPRSATVRASTDGEMQRLSDEAIRNFALREPELAREFLVDIGRILALRLRSTTHSWSLS